MKWDGPDSIRSWLVVVTSCFIQTICVGLLSLMPFLYVDSITRYQVGREAASFAFTFVVFVLYVSGPFIGWLAPKLGQRLTTCIGCILASVGVGSCFFAESIYVVTVMWGIVFGLGNTFCLNMLEMFIIQYFDKQRGRACAISGLGICFGGFLMSPIYEILMANYGLSGTFLLLSGILLNTIPAAMLLKKPDFVITKEQNFPQKNGTGENPQLNTKGKQFYCKEGGYIGPEDDSSGVVDKPTSIKLDSRHTLDILTSKSKTLHPGKSYCGDNISKQGRNSQSFKGCKVLTDPLFIQMVISSSLHRVLMMFYSTILVDFALDIGIREKYLTFIPISNAFGALVGRLSLGWVVDKGFISKPGLLAISFFSQGVLQLSICWFNNAYIFHGILMSVGFFNSIPFFTNTLLVGEYFKKEEQIMVMYSSFFLAAPLSLCISPAIGYFREGLGSYVYMLYSISALQFSGCFLWLMAPCFIRCRHTRVTEQTSQ